VSNVSALTLDTRTAARELAPGGVNPWWVAVAVMLGTFMEVLDTTIVNVALPHVAGNLSAGVEESTWVLTSYLVSNAIVLPASGWLARRFGRKRLFMACIIVFTISSLACGLAQSLPALIVCRILQGLGGGAMQPISQAILLESFPRRKHGLAMAAFGIGVVIAPIIGPTLGGWLTDNYSWRWCFYINLPVGILALLLIQTFVFDPSYLRQSKPGRIDYLGLGLLALGLGTLQLVLDKGQTEDWFQSPWLTKVAIVSAASLILLVFWELRAEHPIVDLRALRDRNLALGTIMMFGFGAALYGSTVLYPIMLQTLLHYTALLSGFALSPGGLATLLFMPICGRLVGVVDPRKLIFFGFSVCSLSLFMMSGFNLQVDFNAVVWPRIVLGIGMAFTFVPLTAVTFTTIPREDMGNATGIYNLMRNIGGSAGIAMVTTLLARRAQLHQSTLVANVTPYDVQVQRSLEQSAHMLQAAAPPGAVVAPTPPVAVLYGEVQRQCTMQAVLDNFWLMGVVMAVLVVGLLLLRRPRHAPGAHE
jgi:DHA2 family multidrug resistance protein